MTDTSPLKIWTERDGALLRLRLARPKANIVDAAMIAALRAALAAHHPCPDPHPNPLPRAGEGASNPEDVSGLTHPEKNVLRGVLLDAEGPHFSFGASVEEHVAEQCAAMLGALHALIIAMVEFPVPILSAVRGQCLGGGLEVVLAGGAIFATPDAKLGQPEMMLGVFAPAASVLLPYRVNQPNAEDLLFSGRALSGVEAHAIGLVQTVAEDPEAAALAYFDSHLAPKSAAALACAVAAVRGPLIRDLRARLHEVEALYLNRLMKTHDANEGLAAFLARRTPTWEHV